MNSPNFLLRLDQALATWPRWRADIAAPPRIEGELLGGLSNHSWRVSTSAGPAVVRVNSSRDAVFNIDRLREQRILHALAGQPFAPEVWHCDPQQGVLVTRFVEGQTLTDDAWGNPRIQEQVGELLARMQRIPLDLPRFDYWQHLGHYRAQLELTGRAIPSDLDELFRQSSDALLKFQDGPWRPTLTHHDLTPANLIASERGLVLIDWEYAALGYPGLDGLPWFGGDDPFACEVAAYRRLIDSYWGLLAA